MFIRVSEDIIKNKNLLNNVKYQKNYLKCRKLNIKIKIVKKSQKMQNINYLVLHAIETQFHLRKNRKKELPKQNTYSPGGDNQN